MDAVGRARSFIPVIIFVSLAGAIVSGIWAPTAGAPRSPIVRGHEVIFLAQGDPSDPPRIVADFNGWEGAAMTTSADGRTYTLRVTLDPAARIEYLIAYRARF